MPDRTGNGSAALFETLEPRNLFSSTFLAHFDDGSSAVAPVSAIDFAVADSAVELSAPVNAIDSGGGNGLSGTNGLDANVSISGSGGDFSTNKGIYIDQPILDSYLFIKNGTRTVTVSDLDEIDAGDQVVVTLHGVGDASNQDTRFTLRYNGSTIGTQDTDYDSGNLADTYVTFSFVKQAGVDSFEFDFVNNGTGSTTGAVGGFSITTGPTNGTAIRINAGGDAHVDSEGNLFLADQYRVGGGSVRTETGDVFIPGTGFDTSDDEDVDDILYQVYTYDSNFGYEIPVGDGLYTVKLHYAETFFADIGERIFDVTLEGLLVADNLDVFEVRQNAFTPGNYAALIQEYNLVEVTDGFLSLNLESQGSDGANNAMIAAIEVIPVEGPSLAVVPTDGGTLVEETGLTDTYRLSLTEAPTSNVVVTIATDSAQVTTDKNTVTFTPSNYDVPQTVTLGAVDDSDAEGTRNILVTHTLASADPNYNGAADSLIVTVIDDDAVSVVFTRRNLATSLATPIAGTFGPDGRLYVANQFGVIEAYTFDNDYNVIATQTINTIANQSGYNNVLGITFDPFEEVAPGEAGTLYVARSQLFVGTDEYGSRVSALSGPDFTTLTDVVTGLAVSGFDHGVNGLQFDGEGNLLIAIGGNTNTGVFDGVYGSQAPESPLTSAVLRARIHDPNFNGNIQYEFIDPNDSELLAIAAANNDPNPDPNNQTYGEFVKVVDVPGQIEVETYAVGLRNPFDIVYTTDGVLLGTDNGPNGIAEDEFNYIPEDAFLGHPSIPRGKLDPRQTLENAEYDVNAPSTADYTAPLAELDSSTDGIDEYRAQTFNGLLRGQILAQKYNGQVYFFELDETGTQLVNTNIRNDVADGLDIVTGPGGVIFGIDRNQNRITIAEPVDLEVTDPTVYDIFPFRAPAVGGNQFVIGGKNFGSLANTTVTIGGVQATVTSVESNRIVGVFPPIGGTEGLLDVVVTSDGTTSTLEGAFLPLGEGPDATLAGDYNDDGAVNQSDLDLVLLNWGGDASQVAGWINDLPDGIISQAALDGVLLNWGNTSAASSTFAFASASSTAADEGTEAADEPEELAVEVEELPATAVATSVDVTSPIASLTVSNPTLTGADIGPVGVAGNTQFDSGSGTYTLQGSGSDIFGTSDQFHYAYQQWTGDGTIIARVTGVANTNSGAKGGVMFRESLNADSRNVMMEIKATTGLEFQYRENDGGSTNYNALSSSGEPFSSNPFPANAYWVRLERTGDTFRGYYSLNGVDWTLHETATIDMSETVYVGLATVSKNNGALTTSTFDNVEITDGLSLTGTDIGTVGVTGSTSFDDGTYTVQASGDDIFGNDDAFHYAYQAWTGDGSITARVTGILNTNNGAKGGVMFRESLSDDSRNAMMEIKAATGSEFQYRSSDGGSTDYTGTGSGDEPFASNPFPANAYWVRMERVGNTFSGYYSLDGTNWILQGQATISMSETIYVGLATVSKNNGALTTVTFDSVAINSQTFGTDDNFEEPSGGTGVTGFIPLLNADKFDPLTDDGQGPSTFFTDEDEWYTYRNNSNGVSEGYDEDEGKSPTDDDVVFRLTNDGYLHILGIPDTGQTEPYGYISTEDSFRNYHFSLEYRWGTEKFDPRNTAIRDSGLLYHANQPDESSSAWPDSVETQIQETDTGDFIFLWTGQEARGRVTVEEGTNIYQPGGVDGGETGGRVIKSETVDDLINWNRVEVIVEEDAATVIVNGVVVNRGTDFVYGTSSFSVPLTEGKIQLQAEGAEIFYRNIELKPTSAVGGYGDFNVLVFQETAAFDHRNTGSIQAAQAAIEALGASNNFNVDVANSSTGVFTEANLAQYDAIVWNSTSGNVLNETEQAAFEQYIQNGGGYVGIHAAADTEYDWAWYGDLVGAYFQNHPSQQQATVNVDPESFLDVGGSGLAHPSVDTFPLGGWELFEEWYNFQSNPRADVNVLLTVDESTYNEGDGNSVDDDHPISWWHDYDGGRSFYTGLGHRPDVYNDTLFLTHLLGGIEYAAGVSRVAPEDATVLFDGTDTSAFQAVGGGAVGWDIDEDGYLAIDPGTGDIETIEGFTDYRLHLEFRTPPTLPSTAEQNRGNSGIYLNGSYELQILDSYGDPNFDDQHAGAIYGVKAADSNAALPAATWQAYDIEFTAARFDSGGNKISNARVTAYLNGVLIHDNVELTGPTALGQPEQAGPQPIVLQDHDANSNVTFRNIWVQPINDAAVQLTGDYNSDGFVSQADLDLVLLNWGASSLPAGWVATDQFDGQLISQNELDAVLLNWGNGTGS